MLPPAPSALPNGQSQHRPTSLPPSSSACRGDLPLRYPAATVAVGLTYLAARRGRRRTGPPCMAHAEISGLGTKYSWRSKRAPISVMVGVIHREMISSGGMPSASAAATSSFLLSRSPSTMASRMSSRSGRDICWGPPVYLEYGKSVHGAASPSCLPGTPRPGTRSGSSQPVLPIPQLRARGRREPMLDPDGSLVAALCGAGCLHPASHGLQHRAQIPHLSLWKWAQRRADVRLDDPAQA